MSDPLLLALLFFTIALLYAMAGFGGGSSYLAVLALAGIPMQTMRPVALLCNLVVVSGNLLNFRKKGLLDFRKMLPLVAASVPLAFLGGYWPVKERTFLLLLGASLILAAVLLIFSTAQMESAAKAEEQSPKTTFSANGLSALIGGGIGFLSGLVSIGGGIFLSPVLHLMRWDSAKRIAATASFFILVNSLAGLGGQFSRHASMDWRLILPLLLAVVSGGQIGSRISIGRLSERRVRQVTALLVLYAGINLLWKNL